MSEILKMEFTTYIYLEYKRNNIDIFRKNFYGNTTIIITKGFGDNLYGCIEKQSQPLCFYAVTQYFRVF